MLDRFSFYEAAKNAYSIVHTGYGELTFSGNVVKPQGIEKETKIECINEAI